MRPIGNGRPNSGTTARISDLSGEGGEGGVLRIQARIQGLHERGSGRNATRHESKDAMGVAGRQPIARQGAGRLARSAD
jgi:hypothetical protein